MGSIGLSISDPLSWVLQGWELHTFVPAFDFTPESGVNESMSERRLCDHAMETHMRCFFLQQRWIKEEDLIVDV